MRIPRLRPLPSASELGLGGAQLGNLYRETSDEEAAAAVDAAWDAGIRYFDTAPHYGVGLSERRLGARAAPAVRATSTSCRRRSGGCSCRAPNGARRRDDEGFDVPADLRREWDFSRDGIRRSVEDEPRPARA